VPETVSPFAVEPYSYAEAHALAHELGLSEPIAVTLVRRGYRTPEQARAFLAAEESHPPEAFEGMERAVNLVRAAIDSGRRITVHGDFDVDGVCATTLMVSALRDLGAECDWLIPDRIADGYGLTAENVRRLAERGTSLLITVDCGITSVDEVALAQELGMEVLVTDHHQPSDELPNCLILHPQISKYPFESLCGTAVAWKLACALTEGGEPSSAASDLDLVALATVADLVPLVGENRCLVRQGLAELRRAQRVGIRALLEVSKCDPERLDESDLGFRLAPRINAAGRLYRADAGVELFLTADEKRAEAIAIELSRANAERRATEREVDAAWSWPVGTGTRVWSESSPRGWSSAITARSSSSPWVKTEAGAARDAASRVSTCSPHWRPAPSTSRGSGGIRPRRGCRSEPRTWRLSSGPLPLTPTRPCARRTYAAGKASTRWWAASDWGWSWPKS
jgi:single-stranded-DNA-specific exonuclease